MLRVPSTFTEVGTRRSNAWPFVVLTTHSRQHRDMHITTRQKQKYHCGENAGWLPAFWAMDTNDGMRPERPRPPERADV